MKRGSLAHPKTLRLAALLSVGDRPCDPSEALGIVEALCNHFAPQFAPQGNVGKFADAEIAIGCGSTRDGTLLMRALTESRWLNASEEHRLLIHDWHEHADNRVVKHLEYHKIPFLTGRRKSRRKSEKRGESRPPRKAIGNRQRLPAADSCSDPDSKGGLGGFAAFWAQYPKRVAKQAARRAWDALAPSEELAATIVASVLRQAASAKWHEDGGKWIPHPATFLNGARWEDEAMRLGPAAVLSPKTAATVANLQEWLASGEREERHAK